MNTYLDSAVGILITRERVAQELAKHHFFGAEDLAECLGECRPFDTAEGVRYRATDVLYWLGY